MNVYKEITERYGVIKRCRGFYLYTKKARLLDMYLDGGMSVLGRRHGRSDLTVKQFTDKGLCSFLPSFADYSLQKALNTLFPEHTEIRFYSDFKEEDRVLKLKTEEEFLSALWRPFLPSAEALRKNDGFFVQPARCTNVKIAVFKPTAPKPAPGSCSITAAEKAALARAFCDLIRLLPSEQKNAKPGADTPAQAASSRMPAAVLCGKKDGRPENARSYTRAVELCGALWNIEGVYLFPKIKKEQYENLFKSALNAGILLSPHFNIPSILPKIKTYTELINFLKRF